MRDGGIHYLTWILKEGESVCLKCKPEQTTVKRKIQPCVGIDPRGFSGFLSRLSALFGVGWSKFRLERVR